MNHAKRIAFAALMLLASTTAACSSDPAAAPSTPPPGVNPIVDAGRTDDGGDTLPDGGCFDFDGGSPSTPQHFLNQCNPGECFKFDNAAQIQGFVPGAALPPLN